MTSTVKKISPVLAELDVEIPKEEISAAYNRVYANLGKTSKIRGFRKGRVPRSVLRRMFGPTLGGEILKEVLPTALQGAIEEHELEAIGQPEIDAQDVKEGEAYRFVAKVELKPQLEQITFDDVEITRYVIPVQQDDIQRELKRLQSAMAQVIDLEEPRPAQKGDMLKLQMKQWNDGEWQSFGPAEQGVAIGDSPFGDQFDDQLIGLNVGEEKVIDLGSKKEVDEARVRYLVNVVSIQGREVPELDDEFAKDLGEFDTLEALEKSIEEGIRKGIDQTEDRRVMYELFKALREKNPMELPPGLLERQTQAIQMNMEAQQMQMTGKSPEIEEQKKMIEQASESAREMVHQHLFAKEFARLEKIEVTDDDIDKEIETLAKDKNIPLPMLRAEYNKEENKEQMRNQLLERKLFDFAIAKVKIIEKDVSKEDEPAEADGK